ncbi:MAG: hypothetical protein C0490_00585 [Marivirga sp.]|nr:hypothetical protein [Marivirga sp.]
MVVLALTTTLFSACDLLDKADDVNFDASVEETILITEENEGNNVAYTETITLDATSDPDISKYKSKISGFIIKKISYQVVSFDGQTGATFSGTLSFGDASQGTPTVAATVNNLNLQQAYTSGQTFDLVINQSDVDKIAAMLKDDKAVKLYLNGLLSATPLFSSIRVILDVSVKADAL